MKVMPSIMGVLSLNFNNQFFVNKHFILNEIKKLIDATTQLQIKKNKIK